MKLFKYFLRYDFCYNDKYLYYVVQNLYYTKHKFQ